MSARDGGGSREDKLAALHQRLAEQVQELRTGEDWVRWLGVARRFRTYSFHNTLLILAQRPDAERVAGYRAWQSVGRQVAKGEKGIQILAPILRRDPDAHSEEGRDPTKPRTRLAGYRVTHVWAESQTTGKPLPEQPTPQLLAGEAPEGLWDALVAQITENGFTVDRGDCHGANGVTHFGDRTVRVRADVDDAQAVKTLAHELGHVLLHDPTDGERVSVDCRGVVEVEAESVAYLVGSSHGLTTDSYTFPYVAGWAASVTGATPEEVVTATGQRVLGAARTILGRTLSEPPVSEDETATLVDRSAAALTRTRAALTHAEATQATLSAEPGARQRERLLTVHADAQAFFEERLMGSWVPEYLQCRGLGEATDISSPWRLGYAPPGWTELTRHLQDAGYSDETLEASGLCLRARTGRLVDRFRDRLMLPVRDPEGRVVAFVGRAAPHAGGEVPRYLNSPETPLFTKSNVLFGLAESRLHWQSGSTPVLVEGPLDAIAVSLATDGRYAGVAPCGTALSRSQASALADAAAIGGRLVVALDADTAGRAAVVKAFELLPPVGLHIDVADLPSGSDPADLLRTAGPGALAEALDRTRPLVDAVVDSKLDAHAERLRWAEGRVSAVRAVTPLIASLEPGDAARQVQRVAERTGLPVRAVSEELLDHLAASHGVTLPDAREPTPPRRPLVMSTPARRTIPAVHRPRL